MALILNKLMEAEVTAKIGAVNNMDFPREHWAQLHSTNPLERLNREIRRRATW